jgi:hypothetical protein
LRWAATGRCFAGGHKPGTGSGFGSGFGSGSDTGSGSGFGSDTDTGSPKKKTGGPFGPPVGARLAVDGCRYLACSATHFMLTDLGRVIAVPTARFQTSWDSMPIERETLKSTV